MGKDTDLYLEGTLTLFYFHIGVGQIDSVLQLGTCIKRHTRCIYVFNSPLVRNMQLSVH